MSASAITSTPAAMTGSFAERINYNTAQAMTTQNGITWNPGEWEITESIIRDEFKSYHGNNVIGTNPGADAVNWVDVLLSFFKNIFSGKLGGSLNTLTGSFQNAAEHGKLHELEIATQNIYRRLKERGGNFVKAAEMLTGQTNDPNKTKADNFEGSLRNQILSTLDLSRLPTNLSISLDQKTADASVTPTSGLPASAKALTKDGRGA